MGKSMTAVPETATVLTPVVNPLEYEWVVAPDAGEVEALPALLPAPAPKPDPGDETVA